MSDYSQQQQSEGRPNEEQEGQEEQKKKDIARVADTNVELLGSEKDRGVKKEAAETEEAWKNAGKKPGLEIWRINKFKVERVNVRDYGKFYEGDSYIVLRTYKKDPDSNALDYDLHFWIGKNSTQDEYGTAAYKTVELDTLLDDKPVQHREVQNHESELFLGYFEHIQSLKGGHDSGFNKVDEIVYGSKMFKIKGTKKNTSKFSLVQVEMKWSKIHADSVLLIVTNEIIYQLNGPNASHRYKYGMKQRLKTLDIMKFRPQTKVVTEEFSCYDDITECLTKENCKALFGSETAPEDLVFGDKKEDKTETEPTGIVLYRAIRKNSDDANDLEFEEIARDDYVEFEEIARGDDVLNMEENQFEDNYLYLLDLDGMVILLDKRKVRTEGAMVVGQSYLDQKQTKAQKRAGMCCEKNGQRFLNHAKSK